MQDRTALATMSALTDDELLNVARKGKACAAYSALWTLMGPQTNPLWIIGQAIETAYERGLIDEQEQDWLRRTSGL